MELVLVRHALPVRIDATDHGGPADPGLSDVGRLQAARVLEALALDEVTHLYSSPAARSLETAEPLVTKLDLPLTVDEGLSEFDREHGSYVPVEELRAENDPRWHALVKGELDGVDASAFRKVVIATIEAIAARHPGGRAVLFTHSGVINAYTGHVAAQDRVLWFAPAYASLTRVGAARDGRRGLVSLNETGHVRDLLP
jgi:broad specificity phosphatase PhoE